MLAYFLHQFSPFIVQFREGIGLRWYGLAYVVAFLIGYLLYKRLAERGFTDLPVAQVSDFITWAAVFGVMIGGRLGWIIFYGIKQDHSLDPWYWPAEVWKGGMSSHGGIIGLVLFTFPSMDAIDSFVADAEYAPFKAARLAASTGDLLGFVPRV